MRQGPGPRACGSVRGLQLAGRCSRASPRPPTPLCFLARAAQYLEMVAINEGRLGRRTQYVYGYQSVFGAPCRRGCGPGGACWVRQASAGRAPALCGSAGLAGLARLLPCTITPRLLDSPCPALPRPALLTRRLNPLQTSPRSGWPRWTWRRRRRGAAASSSGTPACAPSAWSQRWVGGRLGGCYGVGTFCLEPKVGAWWVADEGGKAPRDEARQLSGRRAQAAGCSRRGRHAGAPVLPVPTQRPSPRCTTTPSPLAAAVCAAAGGHRGGRRLAAERGLQQRDPGELAAHPGCAAAAGGAGGHAALPRARAQRPARLLDAHLLWAGGRLSGHVPRVVLWAVA